MFWNRFPFARILLPFLTGISIALYFNLTRVIPLFLFLIVFFIYGLLAVAIQSKLSFRFRWFSGAFIILFFLMAGYQLTVLQRSVNDINYYGKHVTKNGIYICRLTEPVQMKDNSCRAIVEIKAVNDSAKWNNTSGKAVIYFEKDSFSQQLFYGDLLLISANFKTVLPPLNPGEYDYKSYLKNCSVEYSAYLRKEKWDLISKDEGNFLWKYAYSFQQKLVAILGKCGLAGREYGVISALLVGYTDKLDPELIKDYQGSGAMHILSVSGMHVGVIYMVLNFFLFFFDKFRYGRIPKAIILVLFVWCYALLTGLSPAILRSATMFTFIAIANGFRYRHNIFNSLAGSALFLLIINPFFLTDIGFQLSYLAVAGIVAIYPPIKKTWNSRYWLINQVLSLIAVSIAAQIVTFPLTVYYFHQFPNCFIPVNIVVIPLSAIVIYSGIAYLIFYSVPFLSFIFGKALTWSLLGLNNSITFMEHLPYAVAKGISITTIEMVLLYLIIILVFIHLKFKRAKVFIPALIILLLFSASYSIRNFQKSLQKKIIVYNIGKHSAIDFVSGNSCYSVMDSSLTTDSHNQDFHILNSRILNQTRIVKTFCIGHDSVQFSDAIFYKNHDLINFMGKSLAIIKKSISNTRQIPADIVLLSDNPEISIDSLFYYYKPDLLILDASNSIRNRTQWIKQCIERKIPFYETSKSGAWVYEISS
jgi:competence protein ComEC